MEERKKILVIDDDQPTREVVTLALTDEDYEVRTAPNGRAALDVLNHFKPHLILLDMRMPVMDGWSFVTEYRKSRTEHIPIVVFTAAVDTASRASEVQADAYLAKPFVLTELFAVLDQVLEQETA